MIWTDYLPLAMFATLLVFLFSGYPVAFVLGGVALLFGLIGMALDLFLPVEFFNIVARIYGAVVQNYILVAIPMFIFMGTLLERSGIGEELLASLSRLLRRVPGGLALSVTLLGTIMAATTGIVGASVVMLTLLAAPTMLAQSYRHSFAMGVIGASGTLGILLPPSIMLVLMADILQVSAGRLFLGAVFPGLLLAAFYATYVVAAASANPDLAPPLDDDDNAGAATLGRLLRALLPVFALIFLVLGSIGAGIASTTEAAGVGAFGAFLLVLLRRRMTAPVMRSVLEGSASVNAMLFMIFIGAAAFSYVFRALGGDYLIEHMLASSGADDWTVLIVMMLATFILGFFFEWIEISLILLPIYLPIIGTLDFGQHVTAGEVTIWIAILFAVNLQTSFLTPPFGVSLFYMRGAAPQEISIVSIYRGVIPFVAMQVAVVMVLLALPGLALWLPRALLD